MKKILLRSIIRAFFIATISSILSISYYAYADNHYAPTLNPSDIQAAVNTAQPGDTVILPAGNYVGFNTTVNVPNGISIVGQGRNSTIMRKTSINSMRMFYFNGPRQDSTLSVEISGFALHGVADQTTLDTGIQINNMKDFKIHDVECSGFGYCGIVIHGYSYGVIWDCMFINCYAPGLGYGVGVWFDEPGEVAFGDSSWDRPVIWGGNEFVFIEDCYFSGERHSVTAGYGGRYVFRYNTSENEQGQAGSAHIEAHGRPQGAPYRATRAVEIYSNIVRNQPGNVFDGIVIHGGDALIFDNAFGPNIAYTIVLMESGCTHDPSAYPYSDQIRESYVWGNTEDGRLINRVGNGDGPDVVIYCPEWIRENRDFSLYPRPGYMPFPYPHPLRQNTPRISLSSTSLAFAATVGGNRPANQNFLISNSGGGTLFWEISDNASWLTCSPTSGTDGASIMASADQTGLSEGTYNALITVSSANSENSPQNLSVTLAVTASPPPLSASFTASTTSGQAPLTVNFTGSALGGNPPYSYQWDFGDGAYSTIQNTSHTYLSAGNFTAILTVTDSQSSAATSSVAINVSSISSYSLSLAAETGFPAQGPGGTTDPIPGNYTFPIGSLISLKSIPNTDYRFSRWSGDILETSMFNIETEITINHNKSISSTFCTKCGDVNGDLRLSPADAQAAFDIFLGKITNPTWCEKENADVNSSGSKLDPKVTPADAQMIFHKFLKKGESGDCSGNSRSVTTALESLAPSPVRLTVNGIIAGRGEDVYVPIIIDTSSEISAFGLDLAFPSRTLTFLGMQRTEFTQGYQDVAANVLSPLMDYEGSLGRGRDQGIVRVGGYRTESVEGPTSGVLVVLAFRVTGEPEAGLPLSIIATYDDLKDSALTNEMIQSRTEREFVKKRRGFEQRTSGKGHGWW